jgi:CheY-like chemotaxis protein
MPSDCFLTLLEAALDKCTGVDPAHTQTQSLQAKQGDGYATQAPTSQAKILVADDNEMNVIALDDYLTHAGYQLYIAGDGEQALRYAEEFSPDLILMDIQMPRMSGVEAIRRLRAIPKFANTPILALTALAMPGDRELCLAAGASAYIAKPFLMRDLLKTIEGWLAAVNTAEEI